jgi:hypothetical protein
MPSSLVDLKYRLWTNPASLGISVKVVLDVCSRSINAEETHSNGRRVLAGARSAVPSPTVTCGTGVCLAEMTFLL